MAKGNKKARQIRTFDIVISNRIHFFNRKTDGEQRTKRKEYYRESQKLINKGYLLKQRQITPKKNKLLLREQQIKKSWKPKLLPFTGGE